MGELVRLRASAREALRAGNSRKLTKRVVEAIAPDPARELQRWDSDLKGFGVRVMPSGVRTYFVQYRDAAARTRKVALGRHGVLTTEEARTRAREQGEVRAVAALRTTSVLERVNRALRQKACQVCTFQAARRLTAAVVLVSVHRGLTTPARSADLWTEALEAGLLAA